MHGNKDTLLAVSLFTVGALLFPLNPVVGMIVSLAGVKKLGDAGYDLVQDVRSNPFTGRRIPHSVLRRMEY